VNRGLSNILERDTGLFVLFLAPVLIFSPFFFGGGVLLATTDNLFAHFPNVVFGFRELKGGSLPLWNPYIFLGEDFSESMHNHFLNPAYYPLLLAGEKYLFHAISVFFFVEVVLLGLIAYKGLRAFIDDRVMALLFATVVQTAGFVWFTMTTFVATTAMVASAFSVVLLMTYEDRGRLANFVGLSLGFAVVLLTGHFGYVAAFGLPVVVVFLTRTWPRWLYRPWHPDNLVVWGAFAAALAVALMRLWPVLRSVLFEKMAITQGFWLSSLPGNTGYFFLSGFIPEIFGYELYESQRAAGVLGIGGRHGQFHNMLYFGTPIAVLIFVSLAGTLGRRARLSAWLFLATGLTATFGVQMVADVLALSFLPLIHDIVFRALTAFFGFATLAFAVQTLYRGDFRAEALETNLRGWVVAAAVIIAAAIVAQAKLLHDQGAWTPPGGMTPYLGAAQVAVIAVVGAALAFAWFAPPTHHVYRRLTDAAFAVFFVSLAGLGYLSLNYLADVRLAIVGIAYLGGTGLLGLAVCLILRRRPEPLSGPTQIAAIALVVVVAVLAAAPLQAEGESRGMIATQVAAMGGIVRFLLLSAVSLEIVSRLREGTTGGRTVLILLGLLAVGDLVLFNKTYSYSGAPPFMKVEQLYPGWFEGNQRKAYGREAYERERALALTRKNLLAEGSLGSDRRAASGKWQTGGKGPRVDVELVDGKVVTQLSNDADDFATLFQDVEKIGSGPSSFGVWVRATEADKAGIVFEGPPVFHSGSGAWEYLATTGMKTRPMVRAHLVVKGRGTGFFFRPSLIEGRVLPPPSDPPGAVYATETLRILQHGPVFPDFERYRLNRPWILSNHPYGAAQSNIHEVYRLPGYGGVDSDIQSDLYTLFTAFREPDPTWISRGSIVAVVDQDRILDLAGVKYDSSPTGGIISRPNALARFSTFRDFEVIADRKRLLERLQDPGFDPTRTILLESPPSPLFEEQRPERFATPDFTLLNNGLVDIEIDQRESSILLFNDGFSPDWHATFAGREVPLMRANFYFMAFVVPAGMGTLRLEFKPEPYLSLLAVSAGVGGAWLILALFVAGRWIYTIWRRAPALPPTP
jgi:hypothetical protein